MKTRLLKSGRRPSRSAPLWLTIEGECTSLYTSPGNDDGDLLDGDEPNGNLDADSTSLDGEAAFGVLVQFVGAPVVGADGPDRNDIIENFQQCVLNEADTDDEFDGVTSEEDGD